LITADIERRVIETIVEPVLAGMVREGHPYRGFLYVGLMLTPGGPMVVEFNVRLGDPETQVVLPLLGSGPAAMFRACAEGSLPGAGVEIRPGACVTVVVASGGYPASALIGFEVSGLEVAGAVEGVTVFHSGTAERQGRVVTAGGRVLSVSAIGHSIAEARDRAYEAVGRVSFEGMQHRTDIAALAAKEEAT